MDILRKTYRHAFITVMSVLMIVIPSLTTFSQQSLEPIARGKSVSEFAQIGWSSDGNSLIFQDLAHPDNTWFQYELEKGQLTASERNPFAANIPPIQIDALEVDPAEMPFVFVSPSGRYAVYNAPSSAGKWQDGRRSLIALADLEKGAIRIINLPVDFWFAVWSADSSTFAIETTVTYGGTVIYYIDGFEASVSQAKHVVLTYEIELNGYRDVATGVYGVSADGQKVLVSGYRDVAIWDRTGPLQIKSIATDLIAGGATFSLNDTDVLFVTSSGMFCYNMSNQQTKLKPLQAGAELLQNAVEASISPNGRNVAAIVYERATDTYALYVLKVAQSQ
jgi:hypothetical protein